MPKAVKPKATGVKSKPSPAKKVVKKSKALYDRPEKIVEGTILQDLHKNKWYVGKSIGEGGFGEIYSASRVGEKNFDYVVKCEPHGNGPLFVEMHFYMRHGKLDDIKRYQRDHNIKSLGMPHMLGNGSIDINGIKHRFIVMPRYGTDIAKHLASNGGRIPEATAYRLAIQMLDVYQYIHSTGYVHADLKGANMLLGTGKAGASQAYLVDFGLVSHMVSGVFKPDPKKMHNGTIEYTSRDAHLGVPTMRADLEILGFNLIEWLGGILPWVKANLLTQPVKVQKAKEDFVADLGKNLKTIFPNGPSATLLAYLNYVKEIKYDERPDYDHCRQLFLNGLKSLKASNTGDLEFSMKATNKMPSRVESPVKQKPVTERGRPAKPKADTSIDILGFSSDNDEDVDEEDDESVFAPPIRAGAMITKTQKIPTSRSPAKSIPPTPKRVRAMAKSPKLPTKRSPIESTPSTPASAKRQRTAVLNNGSSSGSTPKQSANGAAHLKNTRSTPLSAQINFSPSISVSSSGSSVAPRHRGKPGVTVVNDNLTPNPRSKKTYEFNFELDVSMDANVIVNVNRKKKPKDASSSSKSQFTSSSSDTPVTRVNVRKVTDDDDGNDSSTTPSVTVKKTKRYV